MNRIAVAQELFKVARLLSSAREEFTVIVDYLNMDVAEDNWEQGVIGRMETVLHRSHFGTFKSVRDAVKAASTETGIPEKDFSVFEGEDGRIDGQGLVDENNLYVGDDHRFMEKFEKGEVRAWSASVSLSIRFAKTYVPTDEEIEKNSGLKGG